jgi:hypothetical protein
VDFDQILDRTIEMLQRRGRLSYRALKRQFDLDDDYLKDLKDEILYTQSNVVEDGERETKCSPLVVPWKANASRSRCCLQISRTPIVELFGKR